MSIDVFALNLRHLRAALAIGERGSVSAAADEINLSQPALTQGIAKLESQIGRPLFERRTDGTAPTEAGTLLTRRTATALAHIAVAVRGMRRAGGGFARAERLLSMVQLRALLGLAGHGSFVSAAHASGQSQPALHRAVRDMERVLGVVLVERRGRGVTLTPAGRRLARAFRLAINEWEAGLSEIEALSGRDSGRIAIGAMPLARARVLPAVVGRFHAQVPGVHLTIVEGSHSDLIEPLREGQLDMLVGALRDPSPGGDVVQEPLFTDTLAVIARAGHPLAGDRHATLEHMAAYPWLAAEQGTPLRAQWEAMFTRSGLPIPPVTIECGSVMLLRGLMLEGDFLTALSPVQVWVEVQAGLLTIVGDPLVGTRRTVGLTTRAGWNPTRIQSLFLSLLREHSGDLENNNSEN